MEQILKILAQQLTSEEGRKRLGTLLLVVLSPVLLVIFVIGYIFTSPLDALKTYFTGAEEPAMLAIYNESPQHNTGGDFDGSLSTVNGFTFFHQKDARWKTSIYGAESDAAAGTIGNAGCGPTSGAIVLSTLLEREILPTEAADWCVQNGYCQSGGGGTLRSYAKAMAAGYGLAAEMIPRSEPEKLRAALADGKAVIAIMGAGTFTSGGHYIVLCGLAPDGTVYVADPNSAARSRKTYELSLIIDEAKDNFTVISKPSAPSPSPTPTVSPTPDPNPPKRPEKPPKPPSGNDPPRPAE